MASSFNQWIGLGNLTRDVEVRYLESGTAVADVTIAVSDGHKDSATGKWVEETSFIDCVLWARSAEIAAEYLGKGSPVQVVGRLKQDTWEKEGQKRSKIKVIVEKLVLLPTGKGGGRPSGDDDSQVGRTDDEYPQAAPRSRKSQPAKPETVSAGPPPNDDIPF